MKSDTRGARVWFDPIGIRVTPGTVIRWVLDSGVHSSTAYHPANAGHPLRIPAAAAPWDSGVLIGSGQTFEQRLEVPGVYDYFCIPHELAGMVGRTLVVSVEQELELREPAPSSDGSGTVPAAALAAFPTVEEIRREGVVRLEP